MSGVSDKCKREFAQSLPNTSVVVEVQGRREDVTGIKRYFCETQASPGANTPHRREETDSRSSGTMLGSHDAGFRRTMTGQPLPGNGPRHPVHGHGAATSDPRTQRTRRTATARGANGDGARGEHVQEEEHGVRVTVLRTTHARAMPAAFRPRMLARGCPGRPLRSPQSRA